MKALCVVCFLLLWTMSACQAPQRCVEWRAEKVTTYPWFPLIQHNPGLAYMPVEEERKVCVRYAEQ